MRFNPLSELKKRIIASGGFCNSHAHFDRAGTISYEDLKDTVNNHLFEKWKLVDKFKRQATRTDYYQNISYALTQQSKSGVSSCLSFVDVDPVCEYRALDAAINAKELAAFLGIELKIACQTLKGVVDVQSRRLLMNRLDDFDVVGSLPKVDRGREEEHLEIVMSWAKQTGKRLHVHVDQMNSAEEKETELLARKTIQYGLEGRVTAVHSISLAAHPKKYRNEVYKMCKDADLSFITCPTAWIDHPCSENLSVTHNSITPVEELIENELLVALGTDNINDIYKPYCDGDMLTELRVLLEATHFYNMDELIKIATVNGEKIIS